MVFSSLLFLFRFLPTVLLLYFIVPARFRNLVLLLCSLVFYGWGEPVYVVLMIATILITYSGGFLVDMYKGRGQKDKARTVMIVTVAICLFFLGFFKYTDFLIRTVNGVLRSQIPLLRLGLPIGISFYTFQTLSYVIDVYRGDAGVQKNIISYGAYVTMFPQLIAGPIVQYRTIDEQLRSRRENAVMFADGVHRFCIGLGKKVLLANQAGRIWDTVRVLPASGISVLMAWMGIIAFTFQIYFDFSAYSDMAIGLGRMFGFRFLENFNYPYLSKSVTEFWRRWHISLGTWFREYVYIPLGGNRKGNKTLIRNLLIVWLLTGIWHGANWNFLLWGLYYGLLLLFEKLVLGDRIERWPSVLRRIYCLFLVVIGWYIFSYADVASGIGYLASMFGLSGNSLAGGETVYLLYNHAVLLVLLAVGSTNLPARAGAYLIKRFSVQSAGQNRHTMHDTLIILCRGAFYAALILLSTAYLVDASYNPFLYFRF